MVLRKNGICLTVNGLGSPTPFKKGRFIHSGIFIFLFSDITCIFFKKVVILLSLILRKED